MIILALIFGICIGVVFMNFVFVQPMAKLNREMKIASDRMAEIATTELEKMRVKTN